MFKFIIPIFFIILAGGLFFSYIDPAYTETSVLKEEQTEYDNALTKSKELREIRQQLLVKYNTFTKVNVNRLEKLLPNNVDNVRLIMEINQIAVKNGCMIRSVEVDTEINEGDQVNDLGPNLDGYGSIGLTFTVEASYEDFVSFMDDLGNSLRIVDVIDYTLKTSLDNVYKHNMSIKTYWLK
ncbi:MAG: type 4a pilus biogenesis protein PilO [Patescibacteria group bacterium]|nr:type 4a pilus biogenesis protein PilO [Patescibacteria group bacterium]